MNSQKITLDLRLRPEQAGNEAIVENAIKTKLGKSAQDFPNFKIINRSIDARRNPVMIQLRVLCWSGEAPEDIKPVTRIFHAAQDKKPVIIIGAGPAGMFAALKLLELGIKPIIFERGKDVRQRRRDLAAINREQIVNPESNYCFGEGGAGTYSDGKLYTRSKKRGDVKAVLNTLVQFGASEDILVDAHPHIGTNKLPKIITAIREAIIESGGEVHFNSKLTELVIENNAVKGVVINHRDQYHSNQVILATGHSARDIFEMLFRQNITIEAKPFALGVRLEHPQELIDRMQYHCAVKPESLPPAAYQWTTQAANRGVYSFCMCPGGIIAPCATQQEEIVTNGWSPSRRNNPFANSGIVVSILPDDWKSVDGPPELGAMRFQAAAERSAWIAGGKKQTAPAQRLMDFLSKKTSSSLPDCSYQPGIVSAELQTVLPEVVYKALHLGLGNMVKKMPPYLHESAILVGVESRTSSPVRIPRDPQSLQHLKIKGLYPCGEGAGYAGGIVSAAIDGEKCAEQCAAWLKLESANI
jgi:uncharacterized FAD-dependent dehydrogenase